MIETGNDVTTPILSAVGGGLSVGYVAKLLLSNWLKKHEALEAGYTSMLVAVTEIKVNVSTLLAGERARQEQAIQLALLKSQAEDHAKDLNGIGNKVRSMESRQ